MRCSRLVAILAVFLMLGFMLQTLCFALLANNVTAGDATMPDGCHGHQDPAPMPSHSCCYVSHEVPQAVQISPSPVPQNGVAELIDIPARRQPQSDMAVLVEPLDSSPPPLAILRI
jgi:hypothetical protein